MRTTVNAKNLTFLQHKISTIRSALFFNVDHSDLNAATSIISALKMDEKGGIWFFLNNDRQLRIAGDEFPARLCFYRKGIPFSVNIHGCARVIRDMRYISELAGVNLSSCPEIMEKVVVVKVSVDAAEYHVWQRAGVEIRTPGIRRLFNWLRQYLSPRYEDAPAQYIFN
jgi:hypothetical protein